MTGRKLHIHAGRTRLCMRNGRVVEFFRRNKGFKVGTRNAGKARYYKNFPSNYTRLHTKLKNEEKFDG